uniref:DUF3615 domain-containing protein n=1 Tax=Oryza punctata TaxID=4537 RepID=A0A0E0MIQ3_ORYPU
MPILIAIAQVLQVVPGPAPIPNSPSVRRASRGRAVARPAASSATAACADPHPSRERASRAPSFVLLLPTHTDHLGPYCQFNDGIGTRLGVWMGGVDDTGIGGATTIAQPLARARAYPQVAQQEFSSKGERDFFIIIHVRYALHHYNAKHPDEEFDAVKPLMESRVHFRGQVWFHINFWARSRKRKKIKRFFAEVHYQPPCSSSSVCSYLPFPVPGAERPPSSSSVCSDLPLPLPIPVVEACTIIEEPLGRYRKSCAFCRGHLDILHPMGRKFVCGNDKDRMEQQLLPCGSIGLEMPFTSRLGPASVNSSHGEKED